MAYAKPTLAELKQSLADRKEGGELPTDSSTLSLWTRALNNGINYCIERLRITTSTALTTSSGTIALPDDFVMIGDVVDSGGKKQGQISFLDSTGTTGDVYWISGDFDTGFYLNTPADETFTVFYVKRPSPLVNDTDTSTFPDQEAIVAYAYGMLRKAESDPFEDANSSLAECDNRLREIKSQYGLNDEPLVFKLQENA